MLLLSVQSGYAKEKKHRDPRIVIVTTPRLSWEELEKANTPNIDHLIDRGSIAALSVRVLGSTNIHAKGYVTLSSGRRSTAPDANQATFFNPRESYDSKNVGKLFTYQRGDKWNRSAAAVGINFSLAVEANKKTLDQAQVGTFAQTLINNGRSIAVFGNADSCERIDSECFDRSIGYIGADRNGVMQYGNISRSTIVEKDSSGQLRTNYSQLTPLVTSSIKHHDITAIECSDLERIDARRIRMKEEVFEAEFIAAIQKCDQLIGDVTRDIDLTKGQIYVFSPNAPRDNEQTTVFIAAGKNIPQGFASSSTTRIRGAVTLVDVTPNILKVYGIQVPDVMNQSELDWQASHLSSGERIAILNDMNSRAVAREATLKPTIWFFVTIFALMVLVTLFAATRKNATVKIARYISFYVLTLPLITFLLQPFMKVLYDPVLLVTSIATIAAILGALLYYLGHAFGTIKVIACYSGVYILLQIMDITFGGRLQFNSIFGNATIVAGRFVGLNNQSFALLASASLVFVATVSQLSIHKPQSTQNKIHIFLILLLVIILSVDGAPQLGSDVGGVLALTPTIVLVALMLFERKINLKAYVGAIIATVSIISMFTVIDLMRPPNKRTHLGRYAQELVRGEGFLTIERKFIASMRSFMRPEMTLIVILGIGLLVFFYTYHAMIMERIIHLYPRIKLLLYPGLLLCIIGALLNDSGVTVPSLMLFSALPVIALLGLDSLEVRKK